MAVFSRRAELRWDGDVTEGAGLVSAGSGAFTAGATFPSTLGEPVGKTTPGELLAASHVVCYGIGLRPLIGRRGGRARRLTVTATITTEKGPRGIRIQSAHLAAVVEGLQGLDDAQLHQVARETEEGCTISIAIRRTVTVSHEVVAHHADSQRNSGEVQRQERHQRKRSRRCSASAAGRMRCA